MLPTYEELLEKMAEKILNAGSCGLTINGEYMFCDLRLKDTKGAYSDFLRQADCLCKQNAEVALQALLESLPKSNIECWTNPWPEKFDNSKELYHQLLAMRKK